MKLMGKIIRWLQALTAIRRSTISAPKHRCQNPILQALLFMKLNRTVRLEFVEGRWRLKPVLRRAQDERSGKQPNVITLYAARLY
jgi:hypothetical protein